MDLLQQRVVQFYSRYNIALDDLALEQWSEMFAEQCLYRIVARENWEADLPLSTMHCSSKGMLRDRVKGIRQTMIYAPRTCRRFISSILITDHSADAIQVRSSFVCI